MKNKGLALGGGAVLGAAHIGVIKAIEDSKLNIEYLCGTSIGAFVAAFYAFGKSSKEMRDIALELEWLDITSISLSRYALLSNEKFGDLIVKHIGDKKIEDSEIPLSFIATDATTGDRVTLSSGSIAEAVMASTCIPGVFKPISLNDRMLVDGGIVENVPIESTRKLGADFVIGVDLNSSHKYQKPDNILDVIINSFHFVMKNSTKVQLEKADMLIKPDLSSFNRSGMDQVDALIERGFEDARRCISDLE